MNFSINKNIIILSLAFLLIFFGYSGVQQYLTIFFSESQKAAVGFWSLILVYTAFVLSGPLSAIFVSKFGAKKCMIFSTLAYSLFIASLLSTSVSLVYAASILLGIAAAFLWTGQGTYFIRASREDSYGANSGFFNTIEPIGPGLGVIILGLLISQFSFKFPFLIFAAFPLAGLFLLFFLQDLKDSSETRKNYRFSFLKKILISPTALKVSAIWFAPYFVLGLVFGILPLQIKYNLGILYVGIFSFAIYILPILISYFLGRLSDARGRQEMLVISYIFLIAGLTFMLFNLSSFFIIGLSLLILNMAIVRIAIYALIGDVGSQNNLEFISALFNMVGNVAVVAALVISQIFKTDIKLIYIFSILISLTAFFILIPLFRMKTSVIKEKIIQETA